VLFTYSTADLPTLRDAMGTDFGKQWRRAIGHDGAHPPSIELSVGNRYFAVTDEHLADTPAELHQVDLDTLLWLIREAGPAFIENKCTNRKTKSTSGLFDDSPVDDLPLRIEAASSRLPTLAKRWRGDWAGLRDKSRSGRAMSLAAALKKAGFSQVEVATALTLHADTKAWAAEATARDIDRIFYKSRSEPNPKQTRPKDLGADPDETPEWAECLQRDDRGQVIPNLANATLALRQAPALTGLVA
jgi:hypothetical protein